MFIIGFFLVFLLIKTPQQKWKEAIVAYRKKCQKILGLSKSIRYAGIINEYGRTLTGLVRPKVIPLWSAEEVKNEFFIISTLMTLRKSYAKKNWCVGFYIIIAPKSYHTCISKKKHNLLCIYRHQNKKYRKFSF